MAKKRISEEQARAIVQEVAKGAKPADLAKKHGFSLGTYYNWRAKFAGGAKKAKAAPKKAAPKKAAPAKAKAAPKKAAPAKAKAAPKKAAPKKAAPAKAKAAPAKAKAAPKKAKATTGKRRGRKPGRKPATRRATSSKRTPAAIKAEVVKLQGQIKSIEAKIAKLKADYTNAVFG